MKTDGREKRHIGAKIAACVGVVLLLAMAARAVYHAASPKTYLGRVIHVERLNVDKALLTMHLTDGNAVKLLLDMTENDGVYAMEGVERADGELVLVETRGIDLLGMHPQVVSVTSVKMLRDSHGTWYDDDGHPLEDA